MINYFYKIENKINSKFYYGVHKTENINDGYMGSGKRLKYAIKKYGKENFNKEVLFTFDTFQDALDYESEFVNEQLLMDPSCYNLKVGGFGGWDFINSLPETNEVRIKRIKSISTKISELYQNGSLKSKGWINKDKKGKILSQHTKDLISENNKNKLSIEEINIRLNDLKTIDKKRGWVTILAKKWNISHTQVIRYTNKCGGSSDGRAQP